MRWEQVGIFSGIPLQIPEVRTDWEVKRKESIARVPQIPQVLIPKALKIVLSICGYTDNFLKKISHLRKAQLLEK